ncbi:MAG: type III-B CRISPR module RAMP protein Cmr4 [Bacillota bacterium]|jgi:CRISPR-associated protein Cmr4
MEGLVLGLFTETSLHLGTEIDVGVVDLPVAREVTTNYPVIPGSSLKGSLRSWAEEIWDEDKSRVDSVFGKPNAAGNIAVTDARLLLLPVRTLSGHYRWVMCPYILERWQRDLRLAGISCNLPGITLKGKEALGHKKEQIYLEEYSVEIKENSEMILAIATNLGKLIVHDSVKSRLVDQLVVISDDYFNHFAKYALQVRARNSLDDDFKTSNNLWYEESVPSDTLFYSILLAPPAGQNKLTHVKDLLDSRRYLQLGGNETIGQGWCAIEYIPGGAFQ